MTAAHEALVRTAQQIIASKFAFFKREGPAATIEDTWQQRSARAIIAEVLRTLETVTPEMETAWIDPRGQRSPANWPILNWLAMLRASALNPEAK